MKEKLIQLALEARLKAYAPYSDFKVGAALLTQSGKIYTGCNVENVSYGAAICAERTAAVKAVSDGERSFKALAVATASATPIAPCGICRQFLSEFGMDLQIYLVNPQGTVIETSLQECFPNIMTSNDLVEGRGEDGI